MDWSCRLLHGQPKQPFERNHSQFITRRIVLSKKKKKYEKIFSSFFIAFEKKVFWFTLYLIYLNVPLTLASFLSSWTIYTMRKCILHASVLCATSIIDVPNHSRMHSNVIFIYISRAIFLTKFQSCSFRHIRLTNSIWVWTVVMHSIEYVENICRLPLCTVEALIFHSRLMEITSVLN